MEPGDGGSDAGEGAEGLDGVGVLGADVDADG
jgi:hypothetical protein